MQPHTVAHRDHYLPALGLNCAGISLGKFGYLGAGAFCAAALPRLTPTSMHVTLKDPKRWFVSMAGDYKRRSQVRIHSIASLPRVDRWFPAEC